MIRLKSIILSFECVINSESDAVLLVNGLVFNRIWEVIGTEIFTGNKGTRESEV